MELTRLIVTKPDGTVIGEVDPTRLVDATAASEVNGEHSLTITTLDEYSKGDRILWEDARGYWHEHVVNACDASHEGGMTVYEHYCVWSLQYDLAQTFVSAMPGVQSPTTAREALVAALSGTERWAVGTVDVTTTGGASMWRMSGWEAIGVLVKTWGGEVDADIEVGLSGVVSRSVDLLAHVGATEVTRRFDFGHDVSGLRRNVLDNRWTARVVPLGKGEATEGGGHGRKVTIESVNGGVLWLENSATVPLVRLPVGSGYEIPVQVVENSDIEDPQTLKDWALANLDEWTTPKVSYELGVIQMAQAGASAQGVSLGDEVYVVDRKFGGDGLALEARVVRIEESLVDPSRLTVTISNVRDGLGRQLGSLSNAVTILSDSLAAQNEYQSSSTYLDELLGRLNDEINATGGYTYITQGEGIRTYDVPVSDPLVGDEASKVVEVKGGNIRIADSKDSAGNWEWRTVIQSGYIAADVLNASNIQTGTITSYDGDSFWDLDTGVFERNLLWEPILTEASITTSSSSNTTYGSSITTDTTYIRNGRYLVFFTTTTQIQGDMEVTLYPVSGSIVMTLLRQQLVRSGTGSYRYAAIVVWTGSNGYTGHFRARFTTTRATSSDPYPVYSISDVRAYAWPLTGSGTIGFNIHSQDNADTMKMLFTGGGVNISINNNETTIIPGEIDLTSLGDTQPVISFNPTSSNAKISYDVDDDMLSLGGSSRVLVGGTYSASAAKYGLYVNTALTVGPGWSTFTTTTKTDVFTSTGGSGVGITTVMAIKWGPFVRLRITGSSSSSTSYTNGIHLFGGVGTLLGSFTDAYKPMAADSKNTQEYVVGRVDSATTSSISPIGTAYFTYNATGIYIEKIILNNISTTSTGGFRYGLTILYVRNI